MDKERSTRKLKVDLGDLTLALENNSWEEEYYLDLETGSIILVTSEVTQELEKVYLQVYDEEAGESARVEAAIHQSDEADWLKEMMVEAYRVEKEFGVRYISIRCPDPHFGYCDMQDFISTVKDRKLRERLWEAIQGRGAFRRFKDLLARYPEERSRWFQFSDERMQERAREWLKAEGIELV